MKRKPGINILPSGLQQTTSRFNPPSASLSWGQIGCNSSSVQTADRIWHLFRAIAVWRLSVEFLRLVPYLMSFSLVRHAFELKGMLFLVVRYQHLSVSRGRRMALRLQIMSKNNITVMWFSQSSVNWRWRLPSFPPEVKNIPTADSEIIRLWQHPSTPRFARSFNIAITDVSLQLGYHLSSFLIDLLIANFGLQTC